MPSESVCGAHYKVVSGDTLSGIALRCHVRMRDLAKTNNLLPPYFIYVNQILSLNGVTPQSLSVDGKKRVSKPDKQTIKKASSKPVIKVVKSPVVKPVVRTLSKPASRTASAVAKPVPVVTSSAQSKPFKWQWPTHKQLSYRFVRDNAGMSVLEVYGLPGQAVRAVAPGKVVYAGNGIINYGWMAVVKHDDGYMSIYAHNSALLVKEGDRVKAGQQVATLGATGNTAKPKLYLEARFQGRKIDIKKVLKR
ncbi:MAG: peptidoglycan DD-metalloendopeptidase family protein [Gammaproteobacteria bacterium]|nr:peptidoglycan DD-metalloendopeptidase family protein [Gammaproteobacteria bacterium]